MTISDIAKTRISADASRDVSAPEQLNERTPAHLVGDMHAAFGSHRARAVHAKGIIATGTFIPNAEARGLCSASLFAGNTPVIVRLSDFTGLPDIRDTDPHGQPRGMAIKFLLPDGSNYDVINHSFNGFPVATSAKFGELLLAISASGPSVQAPTPLDQFLEAHPAARHFLTSQTPPPASFATTSFFGVNAFQFTGPGGTLAYVRYRFIPTAGERYLDATELAGKSTAYLMEEIVARVAVAPVEFTWLAQIAQEGDAIEDPSTPWPEERRLIKLGTVRIDDVRPHSSKADHALLFLPGSTPPGIAIADPMLTIRNAAYPVSYAERSAPA